METASTLRARIRSLLKAAGIEEADLETEFLLREALSVDQSVLIAYRDRPVSEEEAARIEDWALQRSRRVPLAHILGYAEFFGRRFRSDRRALVPRKETELLVECALSTRVPEGRWLDAACGTGCIGLTLALEMPDREIDLSDISGEALELAAENKRLLGVRNAALLRGSWFESARERYAAITCNPPYILPSEEESLSPEVLHDPREALFHPNPVQLYEFLLEEALAWLLPGGWIFFELGGNLGPAVLAAARRLYAEAKLFQDYAGLDRFIAARMD